MNHNHLTHTLVWSPEVRVRNKGVFLPTSVKAPEGITDGKRAGGDEKEE